MRSLPDRPATARNGRPGTSARAVSDPETAPPVQGGITARELADRLPRRRESLRLTPDALERWLLDAGLARRDGDRLRPTRQGIEAGSDLHV